MYTNIHIYLCIQKQKIMEKKNKEPNFKKDERKAILISPEVHSKLRYYSFIKKSQMVNIAEKAILKEIES